MMEHFPVSSTSLAMVGFDPETLTLSVSFHNGTEYHYYNVPQEVFEGIRAATSPGKFLDANIKKAGYSYARVR
jgi:hypothetical protein